MDISISYALHSTLRVWCDTLIWKYPLDVLNAPAQVSDRVTQYRRIFARARELPQN